MSKNLAISEQDVLIIVDVQYDFCPGGRLAVPRGDEVIAPINEIAGHFRHVIITQDWHPPGHLSFASSHPGREPYEMIDVFYGRQVLWPDHCVQGTRGAALRDELNIPQAELIIRKGYHKNIDSYSVFFENDRKTPTGLAGYLRERGLQRAFFVGLALDFCVRYSVEDASRIGFPAVIIEDACRAIDVNGSLDETRRSIAELGVPLVTTAEVKAAQLR